MLVVIMMMLIVIMMILLPLEELVSVGFDVEAAVGCRNEGIAFAPAMLGNINTILLVVVVALIVVVVAMVVALVIVVLAVAVDVDGTVFINVEALIVANVVEVVAPARTMAVVELANNQNRKVVAMMPIARIEWVDVPAHSHTSASGWGRVVAAVDVRITVFGQSVAGAGY